ncbi:endoplasmic reticulum protein [Schizopora paradoxa]|uniref:Glucosidase 2 subunit beta n=1 Tax=Schizopora paradoxa TaxID=27342 RepID=A0A0H2R6N1_9AGAM|nr:endoplasmic reticulum protein [Schizopora paradoxa]
MFSSLFPLFLLPCVAVGALEKTHGVHPSNVAKYQVTTKGTWTCLDGSRELAWSSVNDDYCDCPDGSDEPGTSACANGTFYCRNDGHIGMSIRSSRVNDGLCEPECCDGSDEQPGVCPNLCVEIGEAYRQKMEAEMKTRRTGAKIRSTYISFAAKEKKRLEDLVATLTREVESQESEVARLQDILDRTESISAADLEFKKQSPLFESLTEHHFALKSLKREHEKLKEKEKILADILSALRGGYNPNYQDMAVLEAVRGWEEYAGLSHGDAQNEEGDDNAENSEEGKEEAEEELEEGMWSAGRLDYDLDRLINVDHVNLLLEHDKHIGDETTKSVLFDLSSYLPDLLLPQYELVRDYIVSMLETFGVARGNRDITADTSKARSAHQNAENDLRHKRNDKDDAEQELASLFDPEWFGRDGVWKKLDELCLEKDTGEYTYEICLFGEARQKPNKSAQTFSLGKFKHWNNAPGVEVGSPEYYSKQYYKGGVRCWNGPERSVTLSLTCGTENALHTVTEPEKCEYHITGTSPALCLPLEGKAPSAKKEEL